MATKKKPAPEVPVIIGTSKQNLWFGYTSDTSGSTIVLKRARQVIYWAATVKGAGGLAVTGPDANCRIGPAVPEVEAREVLTVVKPTPEAVKAFEVAPWRS